ncbi:MAG: helix-turn-helix domain-containing protein [Candidatus Aminicenantes bacterium]|nr:helix-turn-helix domain-containing protein [Candidatus Aminicenantes bacterium]
MEKMEIFKQNKLLTAEEVASVLNVKTSTVKDWALNRKIPSLKLIKGRKGVVRFSGVRLNQWLEEKERNRANKSDGMNYFGDSKKLRINKSKKKEFENFIASL